MIDSQIYTLDGQGIGGQMYAIDGQMYARAVEQQPPQGVFVCDHAGLVINELPSTLSTTN